MAGRYVARYLTPECAAAVVEWARGQGFVNITPADKLHTTIAHSKAHFELTPDRGEVLVSGDDRDIVPLGDEGAIVLRFQSAAFTARWSEAIAAGAVWDFESYMPHLTIAYSGEPSGGLDSVSPFTGDLVFGPEVHEPLNDNWFEENAMLASAMHLDGISAMALNMPAVANHPNRMPFSGVLTQLDVPSDRAPHGSKGKKVILKTAAAKAALPSLLGMGVNFTESFDGHDVTAKIGVITAATVEDGAIHVDGFIYARDYPAAAASIKAKKDVLGFSYELADIYANDEGGCWGITQCVFTGAAILRKDKAAYESTSIAASADGEFNMTPEQLAALGQTIAAAMTPALQPLTDGIAQVQASLQAAAEAETKRLADIAAAADAESKTKADQEQADKIAALETQIADLKAAADKEKQPERKTLSPQIAALMAKADLTVPEGGKLTVGAVDTALAKTNLNPVQRMQLKNELERNGALAAA